MALAGGLAGSVAADPFEDFGTAMKYALPLAAATCAARDDRLEDFAVRGAVQMVLVLGLKTLTDGHPVSVRPSGEGRGFPSGHAASAAFGAADLAGKCLEDDRLAGAALYGAAGATALSRVEAGQHSVQQALSGALIGFSHGGTSFGIGTDEIGFSFGMRF